MFGFGKKKTQKDEVVVGKGMFSSIINRKRKKMIDCVKGKIIKEYGKNVFSSKYCYGCDFTSECRRLRKRMGV